MRKENDIMNSVYDFTVKGRNGEAVSLSEYEGKMLLIVNTATGCGFTPHYEPQIRLPKVKRRYTSSAS